MVLYNLKRFRALLDESPESNSRQVSKTTAKIIEQLLHHINT